VLHAEGSKSSAALCYTMECSRHSIIRCWTHVEKAMPAPPIIGPSLTTLAFERACHSGRLHTMIRSHRRGAEKRTTGPAIISDLPSPRRKRARITTKTGPARMLFHLLMVRLMLESASVPLPRTAICDKKNMSIRRGCWVSHRLLRHLMGQCFESKHHNMGCAMAAKARNDRATGILGGLQRENEAMLHTASAADPLW
jgi:hypothetical protein